MEKAKAPQLVWDRGAPIWRAKRAAIKAGFPRTEAPTAAEIVAARKAANGIGHSAAALAYAFQFEGAMRQWDVVGKWVPLADKRP